MNDDRLSFDNSKGQSPVEQQKKTMFELGNSHAIWKSVDLLFPEANGTCIH
jgi:hypothetical protein